MKRMKSDEAAEFRRLLYEQIPATSGLLFCWAQLRLRGFPAVRLTAEDVVQEVWMRAFAVCASRHSGLPAPGAIRAWLLGIARNVILEEVRRPAAGELPRERSTAMAADIRDTVTSLCTRLARDEIVERFLAFATQLEEVDRQLLVRCGFEDGQPQEVALRFGLEPSSAVRRWHRLRERLREAHWDERWELGW